MALPAANEPPALNSDLEGIIDEIIPHEIPLKYLPELNNTPSKRVVTGRAFLALSINIICLVLAILVIAPSVGLAWSLGFKKQLVVIGALLGIQNYCFHTVLPGSLLVLEARFSRLAIQSYNTGLRQQLKGGCTDWTQRVGLFALRALPIVLGIAYKQFLGGTSSSTIANHEFPGALYGLAYPDLGQYASLENSIYLSLNANSAFLNASMHDQDSPDRMPFPQAYGYNTLVLSQDSAALLDLPEAAYIREIQGRLAQNETWRISASVDAVVATRNQSIDNLRHDTQFLNQTISKAYNNFASEYLYQPGMDLAFGWASIGRQDVGDAYCLMGPVSNFSAPPLYPISFVDSASDTGFLSFMETAQMFSMQRRACQANWIITSSEVKLVDGECFNQSLSNQSPNSSVLHDGQTSPYALDVLPVLVNTLAPYSYSRLGSEWEQISYVVAAANAWWARSAFLNFGGSEPGSLANRYPEILYAPRDQSLISTRSTLRAAPGLYAVMSIFPLLTALADLVLLCLFYLPVGDGRWFKLVSTLAGVHPKILHHLVQNAGGAAAAVNLQQLPGPHQVSTKQVVNSVHERTGAGGH